MNYLFKYLQFTLLTFIALFIIYYFDLDLKLQFLFYNKSDHSWMISRDEGIIKFLSYRLPKYLIVCYGCYLSVALMLSYFSVNSNLMQQRIRIYLILSLALVPISVALLKHFSPIHCPDKLEIFHGIGAKYINLLELFDKQVFFTNFGRCSPAGHASGGFSLLAVHFLFEDKLKRRIYLFLAIILGWTMGLYQIAKGAHYLSDTLFTMFIGYIVSLTLYKFLMDKNTSCQTQKNCKA